MSKPELHIVKPSTEAQRATHTTTDTWEVTPQRARAWKLPPFQRPLRINTKVMALAEEIREEGIIPGTLVLGFFDGDYWLVDGQHRREAFLIAEIPVGYADVRVLHVKSMAELADEFFDVNSRLVQMRPDDYLKALEPSLAVLQRIRKRCQFVGYDNVRRGGSAPVLSMSAVIRTWVSSSKDVPAAPNGSAVDHAKQIEPDDAEHLVRFLGLAFAAWGREPEYHRLWGGLNMQLCMWLYRRVVHKHGANANTRSVQIDDELFGKCLMSLSADSSYLDWLVGRQASDRDRSPAYGKIKAIFAKRIELETNKKPLLPGPAWAHHLKGGSK